MEKLKMCSAHKQCIIDTQHEFSDLVSESPMNTAAADTEDRMLLITTTWQHDSALSILTSDLTTNLSIV